MSAPSSIKAFWGVDQPATRSREVASSFGGSGEAGHTTPGTSEETARDDPYDTESGYQDDVDLRRTEDSASQDSRPSAMRVSRRGLWHTVIAVVLGFYLATCPVPKRNMPYPVWLALVTGTASLTAIPSMRNIRPRKFIWRICIGYLGFYLAIYGIFGTAEEIHIDIWRQSLLWYRLQTNPQLGYLMRLFLIVAGYYTQKSTGLYSRYRILRTYVLCFIWVYADVYLTLIDLARGREHW